MSHPSPELGRRKRQQWQWDTPCVLWSVFGICQREGGCDGLPWGGQQQPGLSPTFPIPFPSQMPMAVHVHTEPAQLCPRV